MVLHAATDALLGALGDGDIGTHFPPSDPRWKGASSDRFLAHATALLTARGGIVSNLDVTVVCEAPRVGAHREAMRQRMAAILGIDPGRIGIKATTSEKMGFTGRREGLAAHAVRDHPPAGRVTMDVGSHDEVERLATAVLAACRAAGLMTVTAESCTGGLVSAALTAIAGR